MTHLLKRVSIAGATIAFVAVITSGGPATAQVYLQDGLNGVGGTVVSGGTVIGQDPDINVRFSLSKEDHTSGQ